MTDAPFTGDITVLKLTNGTEIPVRGLLQENIAELNSGHDFMIFYDLEDNPIGVAKALVALVLGARVEPQGPDLLVPERSLMLPDGSQRQIR